jgi:hypothetical protein
MIVQPHKDASRRYVDAEAKGMMVCAVVGAEGDVMLARLVKFRRNRWRFTKQKCFRLYSAFGNLPIGWVVLAGSVGSRTVAVQCEIP